MRYFLITGGELFNKGAQAMTFITVDQIKKHYPDSTVVLLSTQDFNRDESEKKQYNFDIMPFESETVFNLIGGFFNVLRSSKRLVKGEKNHSKNLENQHKLDHILKNTEAIIDVSGYALSSQFNNGISFEYLSRIMLAKKYNIDMYLMPQSFGPFEYNGKMGKLNLYLAKKYLAYPKKVYAREQEGKDYLEDTFNLSHIELSEDLVLQNAGITLDNVYKTMPKIKQFDQVSGVGIVPNMRTFAFGNKEKIIALYKEVIDHILSQDKDVYLIKHSHEDGKACQQIKELYPKNSKVVFIEEDLSSVEFDTIVQKFDFIIASRFHSIVHAYKNFVPSIALGWATKYHELAKLFNQERFVFDVRSDIDASELIQLIDYMSTNHEKEAQFIEEKLPEIQSKNVFDLLNIHSRSTN